MKKPKGTIIEMLESVEEERDVLKDQIKIMASAFVEMETKMKEMLGDS